MKNYMHAVMQKDFSMQILKTLFCEKDIMQSLAELYTEYKEKSAEKLNELINSELERTRAESQNIDILEITREHLAKRQNKDNKAELDKQ